MFSVWKIKLFFIIRYINIIYIFDLLKTFLLSTKIINLKLNFFDIFFNSNYR